MAKAKPQFLYLMGERREGPIKVGIARNPYDRRRELQTGHAGRLHIYWIYPCPLGAAMEPDIHAILWPKHLVGEWFDVPIEVALGALWIASEAGTGFGEATEEEIDEWRRHIGLTLTPMNIPMDWLARQWEERPEEPISQITMITTATC